VKVKVVVYLVEDDDGDTRWRFPSARGLLPFQGCSGGAAAARRQSVFFDGVVFVVSAGLGCISLFLVVCLVRTLV
jgi:hypothetical protein